MPVFHLVRRLRTGAVVAGGAAALLGAGIAHADDTTLDVNGWTVQTNGAAESPATLTDPSNPLGNGAQVTGTLDDVPYAFDHSESVQIFDSSTFDTGGSPPFVGIRDEWLTPSLLESTVQGNDGSTGGVSEAFLTTNLGGNEVVDLFSSSDSYLPLVNPDTTVQSTWAACRWHHRKTAHCSTTSTTHSSQVIPLIGPTQPRYSVTCSASDHPSATETLDLGCLMSVLLSRPKALD